MRAALYTRISQDPEEQRRGVERQEKDGREYAERKGYEVVAEYSDNDRSGYKRKVKRPGFENLKTGIREGEIEVVLCQHQDRLARNATVFTDFMDLCRERDVRIEAWQGVTLDSNSATGRYQATMQAATDEHYSALISEKARSAHLELAKSGKPNGGGRGGRPFGYDRHRSIGEDGRAQSRLVVNADEADRVRHLFKLMLSGASVRSLTHELNDAGFTTTTGRPFTMRAVRDILRNPLYAGLRIHRGEIVGPGVWDSVVDEGDYQKVQSILANPDRRSWTGGARRYLLTSGIALCGRCGENMVARPQNHQRKYGCRPKQESGCGANRIQAEPVEELIATTVLDYLDSPKTRQALHDHHAEEDEVSAWWQEIAEANEALEQLSLDHYVEKRIPRNAYFKATRELERRIEIAKENINAAGTPDVLTDVPAGRDALRQWWDGAGLDLRMSLVAAVIERVVIHPPVQGHNFFNRSRLEVVWRV